MSGEYTNCYPSNNSHPESNIFIIADSRGHELDLYLSEILSCNFRIVICRGADLLNSLLRAKLHVREQRWMQIYCIAGICDLTRKEKISKKVVLRHLDPETAAAAYKNCLQQARYEVMSQLLVTGMNLCTYNRCAETNYRINLQCILNTTIKLVNKEIVNMNERNTVATPWLNGLVHRRQKNYT